MARTTDRAEVRTLLIAVLYLALGLGTVWVSKRFLGLDSDVLFAVILLAPITMHLMLSGRLGKLKAPGGLEVDFVSVSQAPVEAVFDTIEPSEDDVIYVAKGGFEALQEQLPHPNERRPLILTLTLGREGFYDVSIWRRYMKALCKYANFKFVVILDRDSRVVAYAPATLILEILRDEHLGYGLVNAINEGRADILTRFPGVLTNALSSGSTNLDALQRMTEECADAILVLDRDRKLRGLVEREQILGKLMLAIAQQA